MTSNQDIEQTYQLQRVISRHAVVALCFFIATLSYSLPGCKVFFKDPGREQANAFQKFIEKHESKKEAKQAAKEAFSRVQAQTELVFKTNGQIRAIRADSCGKRLLLERRLVNDDFLYDYSEAFESVGARVEESPNAVGCELWNIEFADARLERLSKEKIGLLAPTLGCAAIDERGERIFWIDREHAFDDQLSDESAASRPPSNILFQSSHGLEESTPPKISELNNSHTQIKTGNTDSFSFYTIAGPMEVLTRPLTSRAPFGDEIRKAIDVRVKHMRTAEETKNAECVWISPNTEWLICRSGESESFDDELSVEPEAINLEWTIVLLRERRRVVHFPSVVKMSFDSTTSNEKIEGRVVDILAVSDKGELVATLVEEKLPKVLYDASKNETGQKIEPRYKIVIWDLHVPKTVEFEKAKQPLMAIEVSQIALSAPVPRKYCKFSHDGALFGARLEPRYVTVWQTGNGKLCNELGEHSGVVHDFAFAPRSAKMIVGVGGNKNAQLVLWEIRQGVVHRTLDDLLSPSKSIDAVQFSYDEQYVYFANDLGEVKRWNVHARSPKR